MARRQEEIVVFAGFSVEVFRKTEEGERLAENLSLAVARAMADNQRVKYFWRPFASPWPHTM